jgi:hypothetical protein
MKPLLKRINLIFAFILLLSTSSKAQEIYFSSGLNLTTYDFKSTDNLPLEFKTKSSQFYELGYVFKLMDDKLHYIAGLAINGFDATSGDSANHYEWETTYMGLNNQLQYLIVPSSRVPFELSGGIQMQLMHIINGEQKINGGGIGFIGLLTIVFITLKLCNVINWSWWWVFAPVWISASISLIILFIFLLFAVEVNTRLKKLGLRK